MTAPDGWEAYVRRWAGQVPPLRPHADSVRAMARLLHERSGPTLLLGVTPELATLGRPTIAVDWAKSAIADIWPGDTADRHAVLGDWRALPLGDDSVGSIIGDGSLNVVSWPDDVQAVIGEMDRVLADGGIAVLRAFMAPDGRETAMAIRDDVLAGREPSFAAAKWRLAMALTDGTGNVVAARVHSAFEDLFPDRQRLAKATGWSSETIAEIDAYRGSTLRLAFPTRAEFERMADPHFRTRWVDVGTYPLAARCPLAILSR